MRERADRVGAKLHVFSRALAGTEVELTIPGRIAFQDQPTGMFGWLHKRGRPKTAAGAENEFVATHERR
jgi:hypothetical protein